VFDYTHMGALRALIANEPRTYREALFEALRGLRPRVQFRVVEPEALDAEVERFRPHLVVCSRKGGVPRNGTLTWVTLYPNDENLVEVCTAGGRATIVGIGFDDFLSVIDGTEFLRQSAAGERPVA
jgi:hypothetical protein